MASPYQQQAFQRKLIYLGCIIVLFTGAWLWRHYFVEEQADRLALREVNRGEVELSGSFLRLMLTGSRGVATCGTWMIAMEKQKKNQWNEMDFQVRLLTKLQPHFITPWLFQSWNLSYNVSVEVDRVSDKYFYIARGISLLAEGERQNLDNPDIRWSLGFYYQHKICLHDETNVLRSLFQLSCIPPTERDPNRFLIYDKDNNGQTEINWVEFEKFCKAHPQLIRRLHSGIQRDTRRDTQRQFRCPTPRSVVQFLADNFKVVSLYEQPPEAPRNGWDKTKQEDRLKDPEARFPVLPPPGGRAPRLGKVFDDGGVTSASSLDDSADGYVMARAWYGYAMEPLPPPGALPGENSPITDRVHQRIPKGMMTSIFRQYPARSCSYIAERLQQEGWFDDDPWPIPDWFEAFHDRATGRDMFSDGKTPAEVRVVSGKLSGEAWADAYRMWKEDGDANHLMFPDEAAKNAMEQLSEAFKKRYKLADGVVPSLRKEDLPADERETIWEEYRAFNYMRAYGIHTRVTNMHHHYLRASVEQDARTVLARKLFYQADTKRTHAEPDKALQIYALPGAIEGWRQILIKPGNEEFRADGLIQEDTAEVQLKYFDLINEDLRPKAEKATSMPAAFPLPVRITPERFPRSLIKTPFVDDKGELIVLPKTLEQVEQRRIKPGQRPQSKPVEAEQPTTDQPK